MSKLRERATQTDFSLTLKQITKHLHLALVLFSLFYCMQSLEYFILKDSKTLINCVVVSRFGLPCLIDAVRVLSCFTLFSGQRIIINGP